MLTFERLAFNASPDSSDLWYALSYDVLGDANTTIVCISQVALTYAIYYT